MKSYKGYVAEIWWDDDDSAFHGHVSNIRDTVHFTASSIPQLQLEFEASVDDYIAFCREGGRIPEKPYSGKVSLRMAPEVHARADEAARRSGKSLNQWIADTLNDAAERRNSDRDLRILTR